MHKIIDRDEQISFDDDHFKLPAAYGKHRIFDTIRANRVVVLSGATGPGKSTQVPEFLLDDKGR